MHYNETLPPLLRKPRWLPVTKFSGALEQAFEYFQDGDDTESIRDLIDAAAENSPDICIPKRKTLVRLLWENQ